MKINVISGRPDAGMWKGRCQGKTLGIALRSISEALLNPGKEVRLVDHHGTREADKQLLEFTKILVSQLNLKAINFKHTNLSIRFDLFQDSDQYVEVNGSVYKKVELQ